MSEFASFVKKVVSRYFSGVLGWVLNFIGFASLFVSAKFPVLPIWTGVAVLLVNAFLAAFSAWREEARSVRKLKAELHKIKATVPQYEIIIGSIKQYSAQSLIDATTDEILNLEKKIEESKIPVVIAADDSPFTMLAQSISQLQKSTLPIMHSLGYESDEEKLLRLKKYHAQLLKYADKLKDIYQVDVFIESTRHDKNIEIEVTSNDTFALTVQDGYVSSGLPTRDSEHYPWTSPIGAHPMPIASKYYLRSFAEKNKAFSELSYINASRITRVFDSTFYIHSKEMKVKLLVKVHSTKLTTPQVIKKTVDLAGTSPMQIRNNSSED